MLKWSVYALLVINLVGYLAEELDWAGHTIPDDPGLWDYFKAYSGTLDQSAWMLLVLMFELETYSLPERFATRPVVWTLHLVRLGCYFFVFYAVVGYGSTTWDLYQTRPYPEGTQLCDLVDGETAFQYPLEYVTLTGENCHEIATSGTIYKVHTLKVVSDAPNLREARRLGWLDIVNAIAWYIVLILLELEIRLKGRSGQRGSAVAVVKWLKFGAYGVLTVCLVLWPISGYWFYGWDAFLWLAGFAAIESNLTDWGHGGENASGASTATTP